MPQIIQANAEAAARRMMVDCQLRTYDITDRAVLAAFDTVPREKFIAEACAPVAYADRELTSRINARRISLAPMILARMIQALGAGPQSRILDVAGGAGYGAAILAELGANVTALETSWPDGAAVALRPGCAGAVALAGGSLSAGHAAGAPYDAILVHGALEREPSALISQLRDGGHLVCGWRQSETSMVVAFERVGQARKRRTLFDAQLPALAEFAAAPVFAF